MATVCKNKKYINTNSCRYKRARGRKKNRIISIRKT